jgi:hypothetical protein
VAVVVVIILNFKPIIFIAIVLCNALMRPFHISIYTIVPNIVNFVWK